MNFIGRGNMNLELANKIVDSAIEGAKKMGIPFVVTVCDKEGNIIVTKRMDGALTVSSQLSPAKAITAAHFKMNTIDLQNHEVLSTVFNGWSDKTIFGYAYLGGGRLIIQNNEIIGTIGASGGSIEEDEAVCIAGINSSVKSVE